jgi:hypothetical protein
MQQPVFFQQTMSHPFPKKVPQEGLVHEQILLSQVRVVEDYVMVRDPCMHFC